MACLVSSFDFLLSDCLGLLKRRLLVDLEELGEGERCLLDEDDDGGGGDGERDRERRFLSPFGLLNRLFAFGETFLFEDECLSEPSGDGERDGDILRELSSFILKFLKNTNWI
jgi:hypothetical protein